MKLLIIPVIAFLIILYTYTFIKYKRRKQIDTVADFRQNYLKKKESKPSQPNDAQIQYLTKYNSPVDYIEREEFIKENTAPKTDAKQTPHPKKLQF